MWRPLTDSVGWIEEGSQTPFTGLPRAQVVAVSGELSFRLLNGRHAYEFRYYRNNDPVAVSAPVRPLGGAPTQGHLSLVPGHPDRMALHWTR